MTCEKPGIIPIGEECCFSCYTTGRSGYPGGPIAIVLHEVDDHIEALNNRIENCCNDEPDCHSSFHYGVGDGGQIYNWVDPDNTAWAFDPLNSNQNCGTCGWSIATQEGTSVDPNTYTINIAISTGILAYAPSSRNMLAENNYTEQQYNSVVRLVGWLADTYGIIVNQNNIWRHCEELNDFPGGCCCQDVEGCDCMTYSDFLVAVQDCQSAPGLGVSAALCDELCDAPVTAGSPQYLLGADDTCSTCGRYDVADLDVNICNLITNQVPAAETNAIPGETMLVGRDCESYLLPSICEQIDTLVAPFIPGEPIRVFHPQGEGLCAVVEISTICDPQDFNVVSLGADKVGNLGVKRQRSSFQYREVSQDDIIVPSTDGVLGVDASSGDVNVTLDPPVGCEPNHFHIKRLDTSVNDVNILAGASTIDNVGSITLGPTGPFGMAGESVHLFWNGSAWLILY